MRALVDAGQPLFASKANQNYELQKEHEKKPGQVAEVYLPGAWQSTKVDATLPDVWARDRPAGIHVLFRDRMCALDLDTGPLHTKTVGNVPDVVARILAAGIEPLAIAKTPSGGLHIYVGCGHRKTEHGGIDLQGRGSNVFLPGTIRPKHPGKFYEWIKAPADLDRLDDPEWVAGQAAALEKFWSEWTAGKTSTTSAAPPAATMAGQPVDDEQIPEELSLLLADLGPAWLKADGTKTEDRSARFFQMVAECRRAGYDQPQTVTLMERWCEAVGKYVGRVPTEVARVWSKVDPAKDDVEEWLGPDASLADHLGTTAGPEPEPIAMGSDEPGKIRSDGTDPAPEKHAPKLDKGKLSSVPLGRQMAVEALKGKFIYAEGVGWLRWDGRRWAMCSEKRVLQVAATWAQKFIYRLLKSDAPDEAIKIALRYREVGNVRNLIAGALTAEGPASVLVDATDLDRDPDLLNVGNGTLHLPTLTLRAHNPKDLITKVAPDNYVPDAEHPDWTSALEAVTPAARDYIRRSFGAAATGYMGSDDRMEVHSGGGENGKTTVVGSAFNALGEYATIVPDELVLAASGNQHPTLLMTLRGVRLAILEELPDGHTFNVARVKKTVGTPKITGRLIGQDFVTFTTSHTMVVTTNYLPIVTETDHGTWRRLVRIPYPIQYGKDRPKIVGLRERCLTGTAQQEAVLAWIASGARDWYAAGRTLGDLPDELAEAVRDWRASTDLLFMFAEECVTFGHTAEVYERTEDLRDAFNGWLKPPNRPWTARTFSERVANHPAFTERGAEIGKHPKTRQSVVSTVALKPAVGAPWAS